MALVIPNSYQISDETNLKNPKNLLKSCIEDKVNNLKIIEEKGGEIGIISDGQKGCEFWFKLPKKIK